MNNLSFDDILLQPVFSFIKSRKDVDTSVNFLGLKLTTPVLSSNMDSVTDYKMASAMAINGGLGCLHRFMDIDDNSKEFVNTIDTTVNNKLATKQTPIKPIVSVGIGSQEFERFLSLEEAGATHFLIDVAHGAAIHVVEMYDRMRSRLRDNGAIIVGNFANAQSIEDFNSHVKNTRKPDAFKIGIGGGSHCTTRVVTGCGNPTLGSVIDCSKLSVPLIADGGIRNSGDYSKALACGASVVMIGKLLAGTDESPSDLVDSDGIPILNSSFNSHRKWHKKYRGSASFESYQAQGKVSEHRAPEGEASLVPYTGSVKDVLNNLNAGLRSSMSYLNASNLTTFKKNAKIIKVTTSGLKENYAHGKEK